MKDDRVYLGHISECLDRILSYSSGGITAFLSDSKTQDAIIRNLEIVGEAVKNISTDLKDRHPDVPWKRIAGMRDLLIHGYFGVKMELVWEVVEQEIPRLKAKVELLLSANLR